MKWLYRTAAAFVASVLFLSVCYAAPSDSAKCSILMDADTGRILYAKNSDKKSMIASTTKIMTAIVVLEHCDLNEEYEIPPEATGIEGSSIYLQAGERLTIRDLLYGMMLHSGNDAAVALALACSDSVPEFVDLMNLKAQQLGLHQTHFENPNGLDGDAHYSTAADLARMTRYALQNEAFAEIVATKSIQIGTRSLTNHNKLLWSCDGAIGVKTGYTKAAGRILVSAAERNGRRLIAVTICDGNDWQDHKALYDYGFSQYPERVLISAGEDVGWVDCVDGSRAYLTAGEDVSYPAYENENVRVTVRYPKICFAPGAAGSPAGYGTVTIGDREVGTVTLLWKGRETDDRTVTEDPFCAWSLLPQSG
ncbi:MAG: D-alanyl-D-alanine carboxypeptidase [Oscillospiraceae bacterium]|nr:D-alanyl-D-alanine carboxypeptidase [Oscillospiraceae bacterium]